MSIARIAIPAVAGPTAATGAQPADASIVAGDFADLLLGQMLPQAGTTAEFPGETPGVGTASDKAAPTGETPIDPALLFASLGLPTPEIASAIARPVAAGESGAFPGGKSPPNPAAALLAADAGTLTGGERPLATALTTANNESTATATPATAATTSALPATSEDPATMFAPAKLAAASGSAEAPLRIEEAIAAGAATQRPADAQPIATREPSANAMAAPLRDPAWAGEFAQKVVWVARQDLQSAQITLNPPQLGPIEISLEVRNDQATAAFASSNAEVREAIESALPRLREMLAGVGVELGKTDIGAGTFAQGDKGNGQDAESARNDRARDDGAPAASMAGGGRPRAVPGGRGLVDTFA